MDTFKNKKNGRNSIGPVSKSKDMETNTTRPSSNSSSRSSLKCTQKQQKDSNSSNRPVQRHIGLSKPNNKDDIKIDNRQDSENPVDDDVGWITVKSNKQSLKKYKESLVSMPTSNDFAKGRERSKFGSGRKADSSIVPEEVKYKPKSNHDHKMADSEKFVREGTGPNRLESKFPKYKNSDYGNRSNNPLIKTNSNVDNFGSRLNCNDNKIIRNLEKNKDTVIEEKISLETQEKHQARLLRKLKIKEEKKRKREEKARLLRDNLRKDTKINMISQDMIDKFSKSAHGSVSNKFNYQSSFYCEEYPAINVERASTQRSHSGKTYQEYKSNYSSKIDFPSSKKLESSSKETTSENYSSNATNLNGSVISKFNGQSESLEYASNQDSSSSGVKKKVKTKDRMNLAIISLLEMKQKEKKKDMRTKSNLEQKPVKQIAERHGKVREGSQKKLSVLKKNIKREKTRREELLFALLKGDRIIASEVSEKEEQFTEQPNSTEQNPVIVTTNVSGNSDTNVLSIKLPVSKSINSSKTSNENLNKDLPNSLVTLNGDLKTDDAISVTDTFTSGDNSCNLKLEPPKKIENSAIIQEINILMNPVHCNRFREYCDQIVTPEINTFLSELIQTLVKFQDRLYQQDPLKAKIKRRFYCGLKESMKHTNRVVCIIMAPNLKPSPGPGCVDELVMKVLNKAEESGIPIVFGLTNRQIGRLCHKKVPVSCFSIVNYQGAEDKFHSLMDLLPDAKRRYQELLAVRGVINTGEDNVEDYSFEESNTCQSITDSLLQSLKAEE